MVKNMARFNAIQMGVWFMPIRIIALLLFSAAKIYAQGAVVLNPMSAYTTDANATQTFHISNRIEEKLKLNVVWKCDIDGKEVEGQPCLDVFAIEIDGTAQTKNQIEIPTQGRARVDVKIKNTEAAKTLSYALFKPLLKPELKQEKRENSISFDFAYQPGILFILKPSTDKLSNVKFSTYINQDVRRLKLDFDVSTLKIPAVTSVSTKIFALDSKKLIRFVRLASNKIFDAHRGLISLEGEFTGKADKTKVCHQTFIEDVTAKQIYPLTDCPWLSSPQVAR